MNSLDSRKRLINVAPYGNVLHFSISENSGERNDKNDHFGAKEQFTDRYDHEILGSLTFIDIKNIVVLFVYKTYVKLAIDDSLLFRKFNISANN